MLALTYILSLVSDRSIFGLAIWSFTGYSALFPVVVAALFWKRSTKHGAFAAVLSVVVMWIYFFIQGWQVPHYTVGGHRRYARGGDSRRFNNDDGRGLFTHQAA